MISSQAVIQSKTTIIICNRRFSRVL